MRRSVDVARRLGCGRYAAMLMTWDLLRSGMAIDDKCGLWAPAPITMYTDDELRMGASITFTYTPPAIPGGTQAGPVAPTHRNVRIVKWVMVDGIDRGKVSLFAQYPDGDMWQVVHRWGALIQLNNSLWQPPEVMERFGQHPTPISNP